MDLRELINGRNPLRTGLGSARSCGPGPTWTHPGRRNPLRTGLGSARGPGAAAGGDSENPGRNPLRTGLGSARLKVYVRTRPDGSWESQSPENGSRLCKSEQDPPNGSTGVTVAIP